MGRYLVYRHVGNLGTESMDTGHYVFFDETDVKIGRVNPRTDPMLSKEPEDVVTAETMAEAQQRFHEKRANTFE